MTVRTSNSVHLTVLDDDAANVGWEIGIYDFNDPSTRLGLIPRWAGFSFSKVLSDTGSHIIDLDLNDPVSAAQLDLINSGNIVKFYKNRVARYAGFNEQPAEPGVNPDETRPYQASGRGLAALFEWCTVLPPNYPDFLSLQWTWASRAPLGAWRDLKDAADLRGCLSDLVTPTFDEVIDGANVPWPDLMNLTVSPGGELLSLLRRFAEAAQADWELRPDFVLDARMDYGYHRENTVRFFVGRDQLVSAVTRDRKGIANVVYTVSGNNRVPFVQDSASMGVWGRREVCIDTLNAADSQTAQKFGSIVLETTKDEAVSVTFKVTPNNQAGRRSVFLDYDVGDWVALDSIFPSIKGNYRIAAISLKVDKDGNEDIEITANSAQEARVVTLQKQFERQTGSSLRIRTELQVGSSAVAGTGDGTLQEFSVSAVDLGSPILPDDGAQWYTILGVPQRALVTRMVLSQTGSTSWGFEIWGVEGGSDDPNDMYFKARGMDFPEYDISWPWWFKNTDDPPDTKMYIKIENYVGGLSQFRLDVMQGEKLG